MQRALGQAQGVAEALVGVRVAVVAVNILEPLGQPLERRFVHPTVLLQAVSRSRPKLLQVPARLRHSNHRHVQPPGLGQPLERGENLLVGQVARRAKEHQRV